jgi:transglutaminase-like putative cysteine protease
MMRGMFCIATLSLLGATTLLVADEPDSLVKSRAFKFSYGLTVTDAPKDAKIKIWVPVAESNDQQDIRLTVSQSPTPITFSRDDEYENLTGYFEVSSLGEDVSVGLDYEVVRREAVNSGGSTGLSEKQKRQFLKSNSLVPIEGRPQELIADREFSGKPMETGKALYDLVESHMKYDKSKPGYGKGDATWACDSQTGNCTDFHSLFISLSRSQSLPAKFEIGFPIGSEDQGVVKGYHCWAWFFAEENGWTPVDISEADKHPEMKDYFFGKLTENRISFSTGRDIKLFPESATESLNYFVYPHVEVDGKLWPKEKIKLDFKYANRPSSK